MKKKFKLENLDCAHCAQKMEDEINKLEGVKASISFMAQKLTLEAEDDVFNEKVEQAQKAMATVEKDCIICYPKDASSVVCL